MIKNNCEDLMRPWERSEINFSKDEKKKLESCDSCEEQLEIMFKIIKEKGWIRYNRRQGKSDGLLGNVVEDFLGIKENNSKTSDYFNFEIKTKKNNSDSNTTLFNQCITSEKKSSTSLRELYGVIDEESEKKILNTTVSNNWNTHRGGHSFLIEKKDDKLFLRIKKIIDEYNDQIDIDRFYWKESDFEKGLKKINNICFIDADINTKEHKIKFNSLTFFKNINKLKFFDYISKGKIVVDFRIGVYKSGRNKGKTHDHGTAFRISDKDLGNLYNEVKKI